MKLIRIERILSVCKLPLCSNVDLSGEFLFYAKTNEEISLVCDTDRVPLDCIKADHGWKALRIDGTLDFSLTGVLSSVLAPLAGAQIPIFAVSTFDTDYILVKAEHMEAACAALSACGHEIAPQSTGLDTKERP